MKYRDVPSRSARKKRNQMAQGVLNIATCQFAVSGDVDANAEKIRELMRQAAAQNADIVHFSECALSGYAGVDVVDFEGCNWATLKERTRRLSRWPGSSNYGSCWAARTLTPPTSRTTASI